MQVDKMLRQIKFWGVLLASLISVSASSAHTAAFASPHKAQTMPSTGIVSISNGHSSVRVLQSSSPSFVPTMKKTTSIVPSSTCLQMYNLPPSPGGGGGGGGGGPLDQIKQILPGVFTIIGLVAFFASPLGGIFFAITNSLLLLAFLTPVVLIVGFQIWQSLNTVQGQCPNCSAPVTVLKEDQGQPSICLNCGSFVRSNIDKNGIELCNSPEDVMNGGGSLGDIFGDFLGGGGSAFGDNLFDTPAKSSSTTAQKKSQAKRESTVIDVDIEDA
uniref:TFIIB-type domain-containing protein n=1 Tax=Ditylum brightwellii TaxID=49249 RepID=A0A7S4VTE8_9STRA